MRSYNEAKGMAIRKLMEKHQLNLVVISETLQKISKQLSGKGKTFMVAGSSGISSGVAVVYSPESVVPDSIRQTERIVEITLKCGVHVIGTYGVTENSAEMDKLLYWSAVEKAVKKAVEIHAVVILIGDLNAGHEKIKGKDPPGDSNFEQLVKVSKKHALDILETGRTWKSSRSTLEASRTLDRCLIHSKGKHQSSATLDWQDAVADHAALIATMEFEGIDRSVGRKRSSNAVTSWIDKQWVITKSKILDTSSVAPTDANSSALGRFWDIRRKCVEASKEAVTLVDDEGKEYSPEMGNAKVAESLRSLWDREQEEPLSLCGGPNPGKPPMHEEVKRAIGKLKRNTAVGRDKISPNQVVDNPAVIDVYQEALRTVWLTRSVPTEWKDMRVRPIPKKETRTTIRNTRPITCLSTSTKILNAIIAERGRVQYEAALHSSQHAYRTGRSTTTALTELVTAIRERKECVVTFLDMSKAFDRVSRQALDRALARWKPPPVEWDLIVSQYTDSKVYVECNGKTAEPFNHRAGVRQGCVLSGMLFALVIAEVHFAMEGILAECEAKMLSYSDDIIVITRTDQQKEPILKELTEALAKTGLSLNQEKTQTVLFNVDSTVNTPVRWLGVDLSTRLSWDHETARRLVAASEATEEIRKLCYKNQLLMDSAPMVNIVQALVGVHIIAHRSLVVFDDDEERRLINELTRAVLTNTNLKEDSAHKAALKIWSGNEEEPERKKRVRKVPQDRNKQILSAVTYVPPTEAQTKERLKLVESKKKDLEWCQECKPPRHIANVSIRAKHRKDVHKLPPEPALEIFCDICKRTLHSRGFARHLCVASSAVAFVPCPTCGGMYTKYGIKNHMSACKGKAAASNV